MKDKMINKLIVKVGIKKEIIKIIGNRIGENMEE
jgi:hypothetical protein